MTDERNPSNDVLDVIHEGLLETLIDEPGTCPHDPNFDHDNYFGCVPKDFSPTTGRSRKYRQTQHGDRWRWNGGCDAATTEGDKQ